MSESPRPVRPPFRPRFRLVVVMTPDGVILDSRIEPVR